MTVCIKRKLITERDNKNVTWILYEPFKGVRVEVFEWSL